MPIIGHLVRSLTLDPSCASLTAVSGAATSAISSITSTSPETLTLSSAISSQVTQRPVSQPGNALAGLSLKTVAAIACAGGDHDMVRAFGGEHGIDSFGRHRTIES